MDVQASQARRIEHRLRQQQAVGRHNGDIGAQRSEFFLFLGALQRNRVPNLDPTCLGFLVDGRGGQFLAAATAGARRLAVDGNDLVPGLDQRDECGHREIGRSHEDDAHGVGNSPKDFLKSFEGPISAVMASQEIETLTAALSRLPGLGPRSARRAVLWLIKRRETSLVQLVDALAAVREALVECQTCGNIDTTNPCGICADPRRDAGSLCVVEEVADLWALDRARLFNGRYHVLGGRLSALDGVRPEDLTIDRLLSRVGEGGVDEVVLAMNATLEGQTTAHYIAERLEGLPVRITQLAHGLPVGGELDYLDEGTLAQAIRARRPVA